MEDQAGEALKNRVPKRIRLKKTPEKLAMYRNFLLEPMTLDMSKLKTPEWQDGGK